MSSTATVLKLSRQTHRYLGIFAAPAILFFAITGALQTFGLHETTRGSDYKPPVWMVKLGQLHKKQTLEVPVRRPQPPAAAKASEAGAKVPDGANAAMAKPAAETPAAKTKNLLPMKIFFLIISISLVISTLTGLYMAYRFDRSKPLVIGLFVAGIVVPALLLLF